MSIHDDMLKHQILIQRFAGTEYISMRKQLKNLLEKAKLEIVSGSTGTSLKKSLRTNVQSFVNTGIANMLDFAEYEAEYSVKLLKKATKKELKNVAKEKLEKELLTQNMQINNLSRGGVRKSLSMAYKQFATKKADEIAQLIMDGKTQQLTASEISQLIEERINGLHSTQARALAKTSVNYTSNLARNEALVANKDQFDKVVWVSVLDSGTTEYCEEHDGEIYPIDSGPRPPAHWGCRSFVEPYIID
jgi:SPP1 gp7 family putative phage head morphogenesis protein